VGTLKEQLRLARHLARTPEGLFARVAARILALCAATTSTGNWAVRGASWSTTGKNGSS
jgi:hypothetical protein